MVDSIELLLLTIKEASPVCLSPDAFPSIKALVMQCVSISTGCSQVYGRQQIHLLSLLLDILRSLLASNGDDIEMLRDSLQDSSSTAEDPGRADLVNSGLSILRTYQHIINRVSGMLASSPLLIEVFPSDCRFGGRAPMAQS